jgi:hypothetical protein
MSGPVLQMLGTRYVVISTFNRPLIAQCRSNRYNVEPFFFSSSINWIPSRYKVSLFSPYSPSRNFIPHRCRNILFPKKETVRIDTSMSDTLILNSPIDITVTLNFIRIMDQSLPINTSAQSTLIDKPKTLTSRLKSALSVVSWWSYFANQIEEIGSIDTLAPVYLRSSKILRFIFCNLVYAH